MMIGGRCYCAVGDKQNMTTIRRAFDAPVAPVTEHAGALEHALTCRRRRTRPVGASLRRAGAARRTHR